MKLALALIEEGGGTQSRAELNLEKVKEYSEVLEQLPPVTVFYDGTKYWLADGFHRVAAAVNVEAKELEVDVRQGTLRDAIFFSLSANASHGIPRSNADKRRAVERALSDAEWGAWSDRKIADVCRVSHPFVSNVRRPKEPDVGNVATSEDGFRSHGGNVTTSESGIRPLGPSSATTPPPPDSAARTRADLDADLQLAADVETAFTRARALADAALIRPRARGFVENTLIDIEAWIRRTRRMGSIA